MEYRTLDLNVISAKDLKKVNLISKTRAYVVVSISSERGLVSSVYRTAVDRRGNTNPTWNFPLNFTVNESAAQSDRLVVTFRIRCQRFLGDKDIGELDVEIMRPVEDGKLQFVTHKVGNKSGKSQGELNFSYKWGKKIVRATTPMATKVNKAQEPVTAFPARVRSSSANSPPPTRNAYQSQQSSTGLELDAALSGLLIADIISNVSHHCAGGCGGGGSGVSGGGGCGGGGCGGGGGGGGGGGCGGGGGGSGVSGGGGCGGGGGGGGGGCGGGGN